MKEKLDNFILQYPFRFLASFFGIISTLASFFNLELIYIAGACWAYCGIDYLVSKHKKHK